MLCPLMRQACTDATAVFFLPAINRAHAKQTIHLSPLDLSTVYTRYRSKHCRLHFYRVVTASRPFGSRSAAARSHHVQCSDERACDSSRSRAGPVPTRRRRRRRIPPSLQTPPGAKDAGGQTEEENKSKKMTAFHLRREDGVLLNPFTTTASMLATPFLRPHQYQRSHSTGL